MPSMNAVASCEAAPKAEVVRPSSAGVRAIKGLISEHCSLARRNPGVVTDCYEVGEVVGAGAYAEVCRAKKRSTGRGVVVKRITKRSPDDVVAVQREINVMRRLDHPNCARLYEIFEDARLHYLVIELCEGGEMLDAVVDHQHFTESSAALLIRQICNATAYMHGRGVLHRDLKLANCLLSKKTTVPLEDNVVKIVDFGFSCLLEPSGALRKTRVGTPAFIAPEVLAGSYERPADMWSIGVIAYVLLGGEPPFAGSTDEEVLAKVRTGKFTFNDEFEDVSGQAKEFIHGCLEISPDRRLTATKALDHAWLGGAAPWCSSERPLSAGMLRRMSSFHAQGLLRKAALMAIAREADDEMIDRLRRTFETLDADRTGTLSLAELQAGMSQAGLADDKLAGLVRFAEGGRVDYSTFLAATLDRRVYLQEDACWAAFSLFDSDGDGRITLSDLVDVFNSAEDAIGREALESVLGEVDLGVRGFVDFKEFMVMMQALRDVTPCPSVARPSSAASIRSFAPTSIIEAFGEEEDEEEWV